MEEWRDIADIEGYKVNNNGRVFAKEKYVSHSRNSDYKVYRPEKEIIPHDNGNGYLYVSLWKNGRKVNRYVHRLVAEAFLPHTEAENVVDHIDHDKRNNRVGNLRWVTQEENVRHSAERMRHPRSKCRQTNTGEKYISLVKSHGKPVYRLLIRQEGVCKYFKTLIEAVEFRDGRKG